MNQADDQPLIAVLLLSDWGALETPPAATLRQSLGRDPSTVEVATHLFNAVRELEDSNASVLDESDTREYTERYLDSYRNELWTWRK